MKASTHTFAKQHYRCLRYCGGVFITMMWMAISIAQAQTANYALGTSVLLVGPTAGTNSVVLAVTPATGTWTAITNAPWLHLTVANQSGTGSTNVVFSYDANSSATRSNTLTIAGQKLTIIQAGSTYVAAGSVTSLVPSGLGSPCCGAVDSAGNLYVPEQSSSTIAEWVASNNTLIRPVSGLGNPAGVAVDGAGDIYIADTDHSVVEEWMPSNSNLITMVSSGVVAPCGGALDSSGNFYFSDFGSNYVSKWTADNSNVTRLVSGLTGPSGLAVDAAGNVYFCEQGGKNDIKKWTAANSNVTILESFPVVMNPRDVAVDGSGNVYIANTFKNAILKWTAANTNLTTLVSSGLSAPGGVVVDSTGNVYIADTDNGAIKELPYAFVDPTPKLESAAAGNDTLPVVLPATENLLPPFAPATDQSWLTISGITNGVVSFSFTYNPVSSRTAHIILFNQSIPVTQAGAGIAPPTLTGVQIVGNDVLQFSFTNHPGASFTVVSTTNLSLPLSNWTVVGNPVEAPPGVYQFNSPPTTNNTQIFYTVLSP